ncbi:L,D-transpeptidase [Clostridium hydrogenum]|uniref:L,D-transpeptidase n=1 Tax=Clostridium hydrogenum TaxID=2855764 RepID=UPI001F3D466B|nr:L,D-transpeptidase [Clostridium hydrogenum]
MFNCPFLHLYNYYRFNYSISINVTDLTLTLLKNNEIYKTYTVAVGKPSTPTPLGNFIIIKKGLWGEQFGGHFMQINTSTGIYGIHGTDKPWSIGKSLSHGCVRMYNSDAKEVYDMVPLGTQVHIY